jgi:hypothetical protein
MSEIEINPTLIIMYKKKSESSISNNRTEDTIKSPKKEKKKVKFKKHVVDIIDVISYKKYYSDIIVDEPIERKESVKCHCILF